MKKLLIIFVFGILSLSLVSSAKFIPFMNNSQLIIETDYTDKTYGNSFIWDNEKANYKSEIKEELSWSTYNLCEFLNGCLEDYTCYPFGYIKNETYCWDKSTKYSDSFYVRAFVNQSHSGERCYYDFQCFSNFCFSGFCEDQNPNALVLQLHEELNDLKQEIIRLNNSLEVNRFQLENKTNEMGISGDVIVNNEDNHSSNSKIVKFWNKVFKR